MIVFDKIGYKVDILNLVESLIMLFDLRGADRKGDEYYICCPFHKGGSEEQASASFKLSGDTPEEIGGYYCFACKTKGHLTKILSKLFGTKKKAENWLKGNYDSIEFETQRSVNKINLELTGTQQEYELASSLFTNKTDYFNSRGIPDYLVEKYKLGYSVKRNAVVFPVRENDIITFYQIRYLNKDSKLKWYIPEDSKVRLFGKESISGRSVFVCEAVFDSLTLEKFNYSAVCAFGARDEDILEELLSLPCLIFYIAYDFDEAGIKAAIKLEKLLKEHGKMVKRLKIREGEKDLNNFAHLSKEEFDAKMKIWMNWKSI